MATHPDGRKALSSYQVLEELNGFSLLEVRIMTGRTHQIRVHLSAIGHPVVGDNVYSESRYKEFVRKFGPAGTLLPACFEIEVHSSENRRSIAV